MGIPRKKLPDADKPYNGGTWTAGRFNSFVKSTLRSGSQRWPPKYRALNAAKQGKKINESTGRLAEHYQCNVCKGSFAGKDVEVDHINPIVPTSGFISWDSFIDNLFCELSNLQVICKTCHAKKSKLENEERKRIKSTL